MQHFSFSTQKVVALFYNNKVRQELSLEQWQDLILLLRYERLLASFSFVCRASGCWNEFPDFVQHHLLNAEVMSKRQSHQVHFEASQLRDILSEEAPGYLFLKGAAYTLANNPASLGRTYSDIDILVKKEIIPELEKSMLLKGWLSEPVNDYDEKYYRNWTHEIPPMAHALRGTVIDIHHNLIPPVSGRAPDISHFIACRELINGFPVLNPAAMLLHSSIHLMFNEDFTQSFRDLFDLKAISEKYGNDTFWSEVKELAQLTGFYKELFLALRYSNRLLNCNLPSAIKDESPYSKTKLTLLDFVFDRALSPHHPYCKVKGQSLAIFMAWCRGHWCKMPLHILIYHFSIKGFRGILELVFGKFFFIKDENKPER